MPNILPSAETLRAMVDRAMVDGDMSRVDACLLIAGMYPGHSGLDIFHATGCGSISDTHAVSVL